MNEYISAFVGLVKMAVKLPPWRFLTVLVFILLSLAIWKSPEIIKETKANPQIASTSR